MSTQTNDWTKEAEAVIRDVSQHVRHICIAKIPGSLQKIYFNLTTFEGKDFCIRLTAKGFKIVGEKFDSEDKEDAHPMVYETPYALLDSISPGYRDSFGTQLFQKLTELQKEQMKKEKNCES